MEAADTLTVRSIITMMTDFGTVDGYVAEMKGIILTRAPHVAIVDVTHDVPAQDVECGRLALARYWRRYPPNTIHVVVIDPGVGSTRAALAVESDGRFLLGPDNGVLSPAFLVAGARVVELPIPSGAAPTFHGRDVFAPAAAALATGASVEMLGRRHDDPLVRRTPETHRTEDGRVAGQVITVDRFGNAITNILAPRGGVIVAAGLELPIRRTYADADEATAVAVIGSLGLVEIAVRGGSAARTLGLTRGAAVSLQPPRG